VAAASWKSFAAGACIRLRRTRRTAGHARRYDQSLMTHAATSQQSDDWTITPPIPASVQTLLLFGGAFDPPHAGHVELPALVRDAIGADWVLYIPAARTPLKSVGPA